MMARRAPSTMLLLAVVLLGAPGAPALAQEPDRPALAAAAPGEPRCPAGAAFSIGGENFGPGDMVRVEAQFNAAGMPVVVIELSDQGRARFVVLQDGRVGDTLSICLGGALLSEPRLAAPITGSSVEIAGAMTAPEAMDLAKQLRKQLAPTGQ